MKAILAPVKLHLASIEPHLASLRARSASLRASLAALRPSSASLRPRLALAAAVAALASTAAHGYAEVLHGLLTARAFEDRTAWRTEILSPPTADELAAFRTQFWTAASTVPDLALRAKFLQRFPTAASLDGWAFKEFLLLDPAATVHGFDPIESDAKPVARAELLPQASRWPDDDERNRHRYFRDAQRGIVKQADGSDTPYDPRTLWLGSLTGTSSQGHAHYGLLHGGYSDDPEVLKKDPRHFAMPKEIRAFGQDFAQLYSDLALLADGSNLPSGAWLSTAFAGAAFHHLEDVANQIHTVQVGVFDFFQAAFLQSKLRDVRTLGGLLGPRRSLETLGLRLVSNHHLFSEDLFARRALEAAAGKPTRPEVQAAVEGIRKDDPTFKPAVDLAVSAAGPTGEVGRALADALVEVSSHEGPEVYAQAWKVSAKTLRDGAGHDYQSPPDDPDAFLSPPSADRDAALSRLYALDGEGLVRAGTVLRAWQRWHDAAAPQAAPRRVAIVQRMLSTLLPIHEEAAARRAAYKPAAQEALKVAWGYPVGALVLLVGIVALIVRALRRRPSLQSKSLR